MRMAFKVKIKKKILKSLRKLPANIQDKFLILSMDLEEKGPVQKEWPNFSALGENLYHCHLSYHWVACWKHEKGTITIEVYYVGSRENAPY